ncbi:hypothetical protein DUNSADRAFT_6033 [Dunaliella salina]|uniref:2-hydroxyacyl-CoA lyase n=1 Tax=Dunaliella salina TaxID=3046 RepID=A0ABQ7GP16_DUNSA|nr:hypothetical protein DUNSADRAFT_6033 [Dunaliella salina]|eukprot:KAF5836346.1 hypothetical protein DUNSADRAFT_6033 [Dunaliella salina]
MRNEQAAGYAAAAAGFLSGAPAALLTVSGPGAIHAIAGVSHAATNCWPMLLLSGSAEVGELGKGAFQELDQVAALRPFCKYAASVPSVGDVGRVLAQALRATAMGRPGPAYVDLPTNMLLSRATPSFSFLHPLIPERVRAPAASVAAAVALLKTAQRPLLITGKGAAYSGAEKEVQQLSNRFGLPVLGTSMGRGLLPDGHPLCVNAARSTALAKSDVAIVVGARLNWMLHFAEPPRWAPDVRIILVDAQPSERDASVAAATLMGDARVVMGQLLQEVLAQGLNPSAWRPWVQQLTTKAHAATQSLARRLSSAPSSPLEYYGALGVLRHALQNLMPAPLVISEGANTMDMARLILPVRAPRTRLDAGTWGTMGVGLGFAVAAAATAHSSNPQQLVVAVEGDSAFGFSGMELETLVRYRLPMVVLVMNNAGIYGGDRRPDALAVAAQRGMQAGGFASDPSPTAFVPYARHDQVMSAFGGKGLRATSVPELQDAIAAAIHSALQDKVPALIDVILDPMAGVESGNVHSFNAPKAKL